MTDLPFVVGLDLSLTGTGVASNVRGVDLVESTGHKGDSLVQRHKRLQNLTVDILGAFVDLDDVTCDQPSLVVIEQPAFSRTQGSQHDRSGLWWLVVSTLHDLDIPVAEIVPGQLKKYATGKGGAGKDVVLAEVVRRFPEYTGNNNNTADAYVLMAMGLDHLGHPLVDLPKTHRDALDAVRWPEVSR